jgi:recombination protein RecA
MKCLNDGVEFEPKRKTAKFCSDACRIAYARTKGIDPKTGEIIEPKVAKDTDVPTKTYDREKNLAAFQKMGLAKVEWLTTGIKELDDFQKIPRGRVTQIQGPYAVGKTTLALNMLAGLQGVKVFYVDSEASLNPELLADLEVDAENFTLYNDSAFIEDVYEVVLEAAKSGKYDMIVIDSLASMTFRTESDGKSTDRNIGQKALVVNKLMRVIPMLLKNNDTALVVINQEREVIGSYVPMKYTPGGMGVPYAASLILALKTIPSWRFPKDAKNGMYLGHEIEVTIAKSKVSQPHRKTKIKLYYPQPVPQEEVTDVPAF